MKSLFLHWNRVGEIQQYITFSPTDPLQWMGAVRMREIIKTAQRTADNSFFSEKVHLLLSFHIQIHQHVCLELVWTGFAYKWCLICAHLPPYSENTFFIGGSIIIYYFSRFEVKKVFIGGLDSCGLLGNYCDVFICCLNSHSDGTHSLQRWANHLILKILWICSNKQKKTHQHLRWPEGGTFPEDNHIWGSMA